MEKSNEEKWGELLQEMCNSGKSQTKWCEEQGINFHTFKYWMKKLCPKSKHVEEQPIDKETKWLREVYLWDISVSYIEMTFRTVLFQFICICMIVPTKTANVIRRSVPSPVI